MVPIVPESGNFRNDFPENFRNDIPERSGNFRNVSEFRNDPEFRNNVPEISVLRKKIVPEFRFSGTFSIMEMEKISGSFPYVNRNPEFRLKP